MIQLFDDFYNVRNSVTEADLVRMMTVVMVMVMVSPDWRRGMTLSTVVHHNR